MFYFFQKKDYLVDHLGGFTDIHNHILPGLDDGAKNVEESVALIKGFGEFGVERFIATPHIMHNYYENTPKTIKNAYKKLKKELKAQNMTNVGLATAAEHMIDNNFENLLEKGLVMPIGKEHLLIEMSYLQPSINFDVAVAKTQKKRFFPMLAHPERYAYYHGNLKIYHHLKAKGVKFQLNMLSLTGYYGKAIKKIALQLFEKGFYDYVGSDVHTQRQLNALAEIQVKQGQLPSLKKIISQTTTTFSDFTVV